MTHLTTQQNNKVELHSTGENKQKANIIEQKKL